MGHPASSAVATEGRGIRVRGLVQGVGFRPTVWRLARDFGLRGDVLNDGAGVYIRAWGTDGDLDRFLDQLRTAAPPLSRIDSIEWDRLPADPGHQGFHIAASVSGEAETGIVPDAAACHACLGEVDDPADRRHRYPFANCTHCGPRLSIVEAIPYDRGHTSMAAFTMCPECQAEYEDPADRRFHAQPNACPRCGPRVWLEGPGGEPMAVPDDTDVLAAAARLITDGKILAIKGIGGFHLACDAASDAAVDELRRRKHRYGKPFALMARDSEIIARYALVDPAEGAALTGKEAPIVLLERRPDAPPVAAGVAPGQSTLGFMLPYTPLHHVLMADFGGVMVLTSGNRSDEPQVTENAEARDRLAGIADAWLMHDRAIVNRLDDSVVRVIAGGTRVIRRARGYAPAPLPLPEGFQGAPPVLAMGAELKNTFCMAADGRAILSQHMGDQENPRAHADCRRNIELYRRINDFTPEIVAVDMHPDYMPTRWGEKLAADFGVPLEPVQHHHAHVAAVMAEHGLARNCAPVLGVALDGLGYGPKGELWGGEFLLADYREFQRLAHFRPVALIGGDKAMAQPWRNLLAHLDAAMGREALMERYGQLAPARGLAGKPLAAIDGMLAGRVSVPEASSAGRLFDAAAAALGICFDEITFEGEAAIRLENLARRAAPEVGRYPVPAAAVITWEELWHGLLDDLGRDEAPEVVARRFHNTLIGVVVETVCRCAEAEGLKRVALTGGVFQNALLLNGTMDGLAARGIEVLAPQATPANDGGVSLGQAVIAAARRGADGGPP